MVAVEVCDACGTDLSDVAPAGRERHVLHDIVFKVVERRVDAEMKDCHEYQTRTNSRFPGDIPGSCSTAPACQPSSSTCWSPTCCPGAGLSHWCRRSPASDSPRPHASATSSAFTTRSRHGRRPPSPIFWNVRPGTPTRPASGAAATCSGNGPSSSRPTASVGHV